MIIKSKSAGGEVRPNQVPSSSGEARAIAKEMRVGEMTRVQLMALSSDTFPFAFLCSETILNGLTACQLHIQEICRIL